MTRLGLEHVASIGSEMIEVREERGVYIILIIFRMGLASSIYPSIPNTSFKILLCIAHS